MKTATEIDDALHDDPDVVRVLEYYLAEVEAGRDPDRDRLIEEHPHLAEALAECLDGLDFLRKATGPSDWPNGERRLGGFRLLRVIGRGGMGTVYEAEDMSSRRIVAVKVLPPAAGNDVELRRFRHEIRAAASLSHPNIVPIETVGEENGIHFFSMKLIEGGSLAEWNARPSTPGRSTLPLMPPSESTWHPLEPKLGNADPTASYYPAVRDSRFIAPIMLQAAEALAHAHAQGIVHRDVKPANLLLDGDDHLWVADFGLAFVPGLTRLTRTAAMVGTLRYMAPEQIEPRRGAVDHRADLYALGATFYELLVGRPAFADEDRGAVIASILADEPVPPRRIDPAISRDLETVVLVLLAKDPAKRYRSMPELADDLRRFLAGSPIRARRPSAFEKAIAWFGRHRRASLAIALVAASLVAALLWNQSRLARERNQTRVERAEARRAVDDFWTSYSENVLDREPERDSRRRVFLEKAMNYYERLASAPAPDWSDRLAAAVARRRVADIRARLGSVDMALTDYAECQKRLDALRRERPDSNDSVRESAIVSVDRGNLFRTVARWPEAGREYRAAADEFRGLIESGSSDAFDRSGLAGVENNQGLLWQSLDRPAEAENCFRSARVKYAQLALDRPEFLAESATVGHNLAELLAARGSLAEAGRTFREAAAFQRKSLAIDPMSPRLRRESARTNLRLAELLIQLGQRREAVALARDSLESWRRLTVEHPDLPEYAIGLAAAIRTWAAAVEAESVALAKTGSNGQNLRD